MSSQKYVGPAIICRPKFFFSGALPPNPSAGGPPPCSPPSYPPARPAQALKHYYSCKEYNTYPTERRGYAYSMWDLLVNIALNTPCLLPMGLNTSSPSLPLGWGINSHNTHPPIPSLSTMISSNSPIYISHVFHSNENHL
jgi:hypothetical protein